MADRKLFNCIWTFQVFVSFLEVAMGFPSCRNVHHTVNEKLSFSEVAGFLMNTVNSIAFFSNFDENFQEVQIFICITWCCVWLRFRVAAEGGAPSCSPLINEGFFDFVIQISILRIALVIYLKPSNPINSKWMVIRFETIFVLGLGYAYVHIG